MFKLPFSKYTLKDVREPVDEQKRRSVKGANHQIRSINLVGKK